MGSVTQMSRRYHGLTEPEAGVARALLSSLSHEGWETIPLVGVNGEWRIGVFDNAGYAVAGITRAEGCIRAFDHDRSLPFAVVYRDVVYAAAAIVLVLTSKPITPPH